MKIKSGRLLAAGLAAGLFLHVLNIFTGVFGQNDMLLGAGTAYAAERTQDGRHDNSDRQTKKNKQAKPTKEELAAAKANERANAFGLPKDAPKDIKYILGLYYGNGENILIRENKGELELLYRFSPADLSFAGANIYPLAKEHFDSYVMAEAGPMNSSEVYISFERDQDGYGITCKAGGHRYSRYYFGHTEGEREKSFRLPEKTAEDWSKLRQEAAAAAMPQALAQGKAAELVPADTIKGVHIRSVYAGEGNLFGAPLYGSKKLYVSHGAAQALAKAQSKLEAQGYGLVLWDAYRPWSVSKLANLALPEKAKGMLEDPETKGSSHNTGNAVDVGLYELASGAAVEMISGYDEPSPRQYASYAGGTSRQRYQRDLLRSAMLEAGFKGIEMEWWHFTYEDGQQYAHLNIPLESLE